MTDIVDFEVRGLPVAQGSPRAFVAGKRAIVATEARSGYGGRTSPLAAWRHAIAARARDVMIGAPQRGPVAVHLWFRFPRPASHYLPANGRRPAPELRVDAPEFVGTKPDADKVARAALDALTGVVWIDDSQVVRLVVEKRYADTPGVGVRVWRADA